MHRAICCCARPWNRMRKSPLSLRLSAFSKNVVCRGRSAPTTAFPSLRPTGFSISQSFQCGGCGWVSASTGVVPSVGRLALYRKKINLSTSLAGQAVGVKEVETGIWLVSFMQYDLGYIDLEEKTLQPLDNPFGPKVLPMS